MRHLSFDLEDRMKTLGWYQIVGAVVGFSLVAKQLMTVGGLTGGFFLAILIATALFSFSLYCGNLLRKANMKGLQLSVWNQALQVLQIGVSVITFEYYSGIKVAFGFNWDDVFKPDVRIELSGFYIRYGESISNLSIWINVIPLAIIYWINKIEYEIEARQQLMDSAARMSEEYSSKATNKQANSDANI
jgi:hypothetical protein